MPRNPATGLIRRPRIAPICSSRLPGLRGCSNWPHPMRPACSALARNSIRRLPIPCMTEARWSAFPASVLRCGMHFRAASARESSICLNCRPGPTCCSNPASTTGPAKLGPKALELVAALSERRMQPERALSWCRATRLTDGGEVWLPADICLRRPPAQRDFTPPFPLSIGSAAGPSRDAAALHGLLELIERDATSLWWRGGRLRPIDSAAS